MKFVPALLLLPSKHSRQKSQRSRGDTEETVETESIHDNDCSDNEYALKSLGKQQSGLFASTNRSKRDLSAKRNSTVSWGSVDVNIHRIVLGDNPSVSSGPPLAIGPEKLDSVHLSIDDFESHKRRIPRRLEALVVPRDIREARLMREGFTRSQFHEVDAEVYGIKRHREANSKLGILEKAYLHVVGHSKAWHR